MRYALISDIHGNLEALTAVLAKVDELAPDQVVCLGDVVGYGANPNECVALIAERCQQVLLGNHDAAALDSEEAERFNRFAKEAINWTASRLEASSREFLSKLEPLGELEDFLLAHSSLEPDWAYVLTEGDAATNFDLMEEARGLFIGHSHIAEWYKSDLEGAWPDKRGLRANEAVELDEAFRYIINVGSVGQPRDGDPRASFVLLDTDARTFTNYRLEYEVETAKQKILLAGLPWVLAGRLEFGQ